MSTVAEETFPPSLLPALTSTCSPLAPLSCVPHGDALSVSYPQPSSSVYASDVASLPPLHPSLLASPPSLLLPTFLGPLQLLAPPLALLPPAPAANISLKDKDVGYRKGGVVARRSLAGGSTPCGKCSSRPRPVVWDCIRRPLLRHFPSSSTLCTVVQRCSIRTLALTGP